MPTDLFADERRLLPPAPGAAVLGGFALEDADGLLAAIDHIAAAAPFRHMETPGGRTMSVALTNCGKVGWTSSRRGYRYTAFDPVGGGPWPDMPPLLADLAARAAASAGYADFRPDACLVNRYLPTARLSLHQDRDELDLDAPIVSVSLGMPATFLWGGAARTAPVRRIPLHHGDVVVWGGPSRLAFHGVGPIPAADDDAILPMRFNLTFRKTR